MANATYVYCVVRSERAPKLGRAFARLGLDGTEPPRLLDAGERDRLVVATAPLALYDAAAVDPRLRDLDWVGARAGEHEAVVERSLELGTVVPMKLFTLFASDARAVAHVRRLGSSLDRITARLEHCDEWGLRVLLDETRAQRALAARSRPAAGTSGTGFLQRKKVLDDERRASGARGAAAVEALYERVARHAKLARKRPAPNRSLEGRVVLDAIFLVPRDAVDAMKEAIASVADALVADGFDLSLTGPWPAYGFVGDE